jgi:hypothetical protein
VVVVGGGGAVVVVVDDVEVVVLPSGARTTVVVVDGTVVVAAGIVEEVVGAVEVPVVGTSVVGGACVVEELVELGGAAEGESEDIAMAMVNIAMTARRLRKTASSVVRRRERLKGLSAIALRHSHITNRFLCYLGYRTDTPNHEWGFRFRVEGLVTRSNKYQGPSIKKMPVLLLATCYSTCSPRLRGARRPPGRPSQRCGRRPSRGRGRRSYGGGSGCSG